jgi:hypothetical protein
VEGVYTARLILISNKNISPFSPLNFWVKFASLVLIWAGMAALIKREKEFVAAFSLAASLSHVVFCSMFTAIFREKSRLHDIATCPSTLVESLDDRKETSSSIAKNTTPKAPSAPFNTLPIETVMEILRRLADPQMLRTFSLTCKWAIKICHQTEFKPLLHLPRIPSALFQSLKQPLLDQLKFMRCTSRLLRDAQDVPVTGAEEFPPGKAFLGIYFRENRIPPCFPAIKSEYPLAPFITVNSDWLGKHHFFYTATPMKTLALIFTYQSNYELAGRPSLYCHKNCHVLILTQVSPFHKNEWWLVFQAWSGSIEEYGDANRIRLTNQATFQRKLLTNCCIRILFDEEGQVIPECQAVWNWFTRFLEGQEVGFFDDQESFYPDTAAPQQRYFMQLKEV